MKRAFDEEDLEGSSEPKSSTQFAEEGSAFTDESNKLST
jgi:hypothetical protein